LRRRPDNKLTEAFNSAIFVTANRLCRDPG